MRQAEGTSDLILVAKAYAQCGIYSVIKHTPGCALDKASRLGRMGEWKVAERRHEIVHVGDASPQKQPTHAVMETEPEHWEDQGPSHLWPQCLGFIQI